MRVLKDFEQDGKFYKVGKDYANTFNLETLKAEGLVKDSPKPKDESKGKPKE